MSDEELRIRLRTAADEHQPDRAAMLARINRRRAGTGGAHRFSVAFRPAAGPSGRFRPMAAAAAIIMVTTLGVGGTWLAVDQFGRQTPGDAASAPAVPVAPSAASPTAEAPSPGSPSPSGTPSASPSQPSSPSRTSEAPASLPIEDIPRGNAPEDHFLWSDGSIDPHSISVWSQSNVTLKNDETVTALDVTIRVALTSGVRTTGSWSSIPNDKLITAVREQSGWLYYRFRLRAGATLAPGSYVFAGQYNHASGGRDAGDDAYSATATADGDSVEVHGTFA
ncbi:hypothetical protein [Cryptosporangium aurantiacum]|uniref:Uncharacterized protein n=1 Tax=Cryptosporangium aurantiacum TaxID=134849 RepID=A0A1M7RND7_9ACTN|nr:hypothetical protein [Cryptosporangium aurantiacum]SHN47592.1 hypothetical protein SAMN05443668_12552 [Cryptosporangium aurantiacum]